MDNTNNLKLMFIITILLYIYYFLSRFLDEFEIIYSIILNY